MSVFNCPDCGGRVLMQVSACPHCGRPVSAGDYRSAEDIAGRRGWLFVKGIATRRGLLFTAVLAVGLGFGAWNVSNFVQQERSQPIEQQQRIPGHLSPADQSAIRQALGEVGYNGHYQSTIADGWVAVTLQLKFAPPDPTALSQDAVIAIRNRLFSRGYDRFRVSMQSPSSSPDLVNLYGEARFTEADGLNWDD